MFFAFFGLGVIVISVAVWWNISHNQISQDCGNILYYNRNNAKCAAWRLRDGVASGFLAPVLVFSSIMALVSAFCWFCKTEDEKEEM